MIVITHSHPPDRVGIRWLLPSLKVYYIPFVTIASSATLPNFLTFLPYLRTIVLREGVQLIHSHASLSALGHEGILHAHLMGVRTVFTDHSLFGFDDAASITSNKMLESTLRNVDATICVSHTGYLASLQSLTVTQRFSQTGEYCAPCQARSSHGICHPQCTRCRAVQTRSIKCTKRHQCVSFVLF